MIGRMQTARPNEFLLSPFQIERTLQRKVHQGGYSGHLKDRRLKGSPSQEERR
jgi:hypothetical protein